MGLSRRRRAAKTGEVHPGQANFTQMPAGSESCDCDQSCQKSCGGTQRRVNRKIVQEMKRALVTFDTSGGQREVQHRIKSAAKHNGSRLQFNANHNDAVTVLDNAYTSNVAYSLNKKSRWEIRSQITAEYNCNDRGDLPDQNLFIFDTEWQPRGRGRLVTRTAAANARHVQVAANELRSQLKGKQSAPGTFEFSETVRRADRERSLVRIGGQFSRINRDSLRHSFELPESDFCAAQTLKSEFDGRKTVTVDIRQPAAGLANRASHSRIVEQKSHRRGHVQRWSCQHQQLLDDGEQDDEQDEREFEASDEDSDAYCRPQLSTVFDALRLTYQRQNAQRARSYADELFEPAEEVQQEAELLDNEHPTITVQSPVVSPERLELLFSGTEALCSSHSQPRKFSVLIQDSLAECVSFEVINEGADCGVATLQVKHSFIPTGGDARLFQRTSANEVAAQPDPCAFLRQLLTPNPPHPRGSMQHRRQDYQLPDSWCHTEVWKEADARFAALRALPMFREPEILESGAISVENPTIQVTHCEICCSPMHCDTDCDFSERSTALGVCGHRFCNPCWVRHVTASLSAGFIRVECPSSGCSTVVDAAVLLWFCPQRLLPALASAALRAWQRRLPTSRFCPLPRCGRLLVSVDEQRGKNAMCSCWTSVCLACGQEPHWPVDCDTAEQYIASVWFPSKAQQVAKPVDKRKFLKFTVCGKRCPGCGMLVQKLSGCDYMYCACRTAFCWNCAQPYRGGHVCSKSSRGWFSKAISGSSSPKQSARPKDQSRLARLRQARQVAGPRRLKEYARETARLYSAAGRSAASSDQIVADAVIASYLLEYACVLLGSSEADETLQAVVEARVDSIQQLLRDIYSELEHGWRALTEGPDNAKRARRVCERLDSLQPQLQSDCQRLREVVSDFVDRAEEHE